MRQPGGCEGFLPVEWLWQLLDYRANNREEDVVPEVKEAIRAVRHLAQEPTASARLLGDS